MGDIMQHWKWENGMKIGDGLSLIATINCCTSNKILCQNQSFWWSHEQRVATSDCFDWGKKELTARSAGLKFEQNFGIDRNEV